MYTVDVAVSVYVYAYVDSDADLDVHVDVFAYTTMFLQRPPGVEIRISEDHGNSAFHSGSFPRNMPRAVCRGRRTLWKANTGTSVELEIWRCEVCVFNGLHAQVLFQTANRGKWD